MVDSRGGDGVDILSCAESVDHYLLPREIGYEAKFNLTVVSR